MRLEVLNSGYRPGTKLLFAVIRLFSGQAVPRRSQAGLLPARFLRRPGKEAHPRGDARAVCLVGGRPGTHGGLRVQGE